MTFYAIRFLNVADQKRNELVEALPFKVGFTVLVADREEKDRVSSVRKDTRHLII